MTADFNLLRWRLETERKHLVEELEQLRTDKCSVGERRAKEDEEATETSELERRRALEKRLRDQLAEIEHALHKFEEGTYGLSIDPARLEALPQANLCLSCKASQAKNPQHGKESKA